MAATEPVPVEHCQTQLYLSRLVTNGMRISVTVKPKSKKEFVKKIENFSYSISVKEEAKEGRANVAIIKALSEYFKIPKSKINILSGLNFKQKVIEISLKEDELVKLESSKEIQPKLF